MGSIARRLRLIEAKAGAFDVPVEFEASSHPDMTAELAKYNNERARGIVHTAEWHAIMREAQVAFDQRQLGNASH